MPIYKSNAIKILDVENGRWMPTYVDSVRNIFYLGSYGLKLSKRR